jgi:hypothetical protein
MMIRLWSELEETKRRTLMSHLRIPSLRALPIAMFLTFAMFSGSLELLAKDPPSDACVLLPAAQLAKVLEQPFGPPTKSTAPAARFDGITGTDCNYQTAKGVPRKLLFRIYVDPTPAVAKDTFIKLSAFYGPNKAVAGNWDIAYLDAQHAIHVQKGKMRYALVLSPMGTDTAQAEKQLKDLATWVAGQL